MNRTLLLVEDEDDVAYALGVVAESSGWTVIKADSCAGTRRLLGRPDFTCNAAMVDLHLPDGWGLDLVPLLLAPPLLCGGFVATTGLARSASLAAEVYARGAACLLWKPCALGEVRRALELAEARTLALRTVARETDEVARVPHRTDEETVLRAAAGRYLLADQELDVVRRLCAERTDREIAAELGMSESALKRVQAGIRAKMGVETRSGVVRRIYEAALTTGRPMWSRTGSG